MNAALLAELPPEIAQVLTTIVNPRARRLTLRLEPKDGSIVLVRPKRFNEAAMTAFVVSRVDWMLQQLQSLPPRVPFAHATRLPYMGQDHVIRWEAKARGVQRENGEIVVGGNAEYTARRVRDWLRSEARREITSRVHVMAASVDRKAAHVTIRDTRSRWGSCARNGRLSFSWRLILAPEDVLVYVAAHEVAHLVHLNHGPAFWRTVASVLESYARETNRPAVDLALAREWLRRSGAALYRYG